MSKKKNRKAKSKKANNKKSGLLKAGEFIEMESVLGLPPRGVYRVDSIEGDQLRFSVGEFYGATDLSYLKIHRRNLPPLEDETEAEIKFLESSVLRCDCEDCRNLLQSKKLKRKGLMVEQPAWH